MIACGGEVEREPPARAPASWPGAPADFEAMSFPSAPDACDGRTVFVGVSALTVVPPVPRREEHVDVEREVAELLGPLDRLRMMRGSYNGPPGEGHVRFWLGQETLVFVFDRRIDRARFRAALRGAASYGNVRVGGMRHGERACATVMLRAPEAPGASYVARVASDGALELAGDAEPTRVIEPVLFAGEPDGGLHLIEIHPGEAAPSALLHAVALGRWGEVRYPVLEPDAPSR